MLALDRQACCCESEAKKIQANQRPPVLFLDFDGVLNDRPAWPGGPELYSGPCHRLGEIIHDAHCLLVLTTSWRKWCLDGSMNLHGMSRLLRTHGARGARVIGMIDADCPPGDAALRLKYIMAWVEGHEPRRFAILDDLAIDHPRAIKTPAYGGLDDCHVPAVVDMLRKPL